MQKVILITGATSGFGKGLVQKLLFHGHQVLATGRNLTGRPEIFNEERLRFGPRLIEKDFDVALPEERKALLDFVSTLPRLDVLINNAGFGLFGPLEETEESLLREQFEVNFFGPTLLIRDLLPILRRSQGLVVNVSSVLGFMGFPLASLYCASKFALEGLSESLSYELAPHEVRVALVEPGGYNTNFNSGTRWTQDRPTNESVYSKQIQNYKLRRKTSTQKLRTQGPEEVVDGILKLIENDSPRFRTLFGRDAKATSFLQSLLPRQIFHRLAQRVFTETFFKKDPKNANGL